MSVVQVRRMYAFRFVCSLIWTNHWSLWEEVWLATFVFGIGFLHSLHTCSEIRRVNEWKRRKFWAYKNIALSANSLIVELNLLFNVVATIALHLSNVVVEWVGYRQAETKTRAKPCYREWVKPIFSSSFAKFRLKDNVESKWQCDSVKHLLLKDKYTCTCVHLSHRSRV